MKELTFKFKDGNSIIIGPYTFREIIDFAESIEWDNVEVISEDREKLLKILSEIKEESIQRGFPQIALSIDDKLEKENLL